MQLRTAIAFALLCIVVLACGQPTDRPGHTDDAPSTLTIASYFRLGPQYFTPGKFLLFETLVRYDQDREITPRLASRWEHSRDGREWIYHLRPDVQWHDGVPFTAADVKFTIELFAGDPAHYYWDLQEVLAPDDTTVIIRTSVGRHADGFTVFYPKHLLDTLTPNELWEWDFWKNPVGNGPYRFNRVVPETMWELVANEEFFLGRPAIDRVRVLLADHQAGIVALLAGDVDVVPGFDRSLLPRLASGDQFVAYYTSDAGASVIWWNHRHPLFESAAVRRALTLAINRAELRQVMSIPESFPIRDVPLSDRQLARGEWPEPLPYDAEQARRILDERGWVDVDGDGIRDRGGVAARFTAVVDGAKIDQAVYVQAAFRRVGVDMQIQTVPNIGQAIHSGEFEAGLWGFNPAHDFQEWTHYDNERMIRLIRAHRETVAEAESDAYLRQTWEDFRRDIPFTFLVPQVALTVAHERVKGLSTPWRADPFYVVSDLWIEEPER